MNTSEVQFGVKFSQWSFEHGVCGPFCPVRYDTVFSGPSAVLLGASLPSPCPEGDLWSKPPLAVTVVEGGAATLRALAVGAPTLRLALGARDGGSIKGILGPPGGWTQGWGWGYESRAAAQRWKGVPHPQPTAPLSLAPALSCPLGRFFPGVWPTPSQGILKTLLLRRAGPGEEGGAERVSGGLGSGCWAHPGTDAHGLTCLICPQVGWGGSRNALY